MTGSQNLFYIIVAASSVGKSVLLNKIKDEGLWNSIPKYSTRDYRGEGDDVVKLQVKRALENEVITSEELRLERVQYIENRCGDNKGVVYYKNNNFYGICIDQIVEGLKENNVVAIISDFHVIKRLKNIKSLKDRIRVLYIASTIDDTKLLKRYRSREEINYDINSDETLETIKKIDNICSILRSAAKLKYMTKIEDMLPELNDEWNSYLPYFETVKTRSLNIRLLYNRYIDNIAMIDYSVLNFYDLDYMFTQARNLIQNSSSRLNKKNPPVFMVCAAPSSGKKTLMEIVGDLGRINKNIVITSKYAKRNQRKTDGRDGMMAIGKHGKFSEYISDLSNIWCWHFHNGATEYAVDISEIKENIKKEISQVFISNMTQIDKAKQLFPEHIVILYLHATHESATKNHIVEKCKNGVLEKIIFDHENNCSHEGAELILQNNLEYQDELSQVVEADLNEVRDIHYSFLKHNDKIDHVLLNTGTREDLVEQMINLINYYTGKG